MENHANPGIEKRFILSIVLTALILVAEVIGGLLSGSLALLSDAAHVFMDIFALGLSFFALRLANRPPDDTHSYGLHRVEVVAALINGATLFIISIGIWIEAVKRWQNPVEIRSLEMLVIAVIGLVVNVVVALILGKHDHGHDHENEHKTKDTHTKRNLNVQSAYLHVIGDAISSVGVIVAAILIQFTGIHWIDPLISILIGGIIFFSAFRVFRSSLHILLEGVPEGLSISDINKRINNIPSVDAVHDLHVWNICSEHIALSAHVIVQPGKADVMTEIKAMLDQEFNIQHTTIQFEQSACGEGHGACN